MAPWLEVLKVRVSGMEWQTESSTYEPILVPVNRQRFALWCESVKSGIQKNSLTTTGYCYTRTGKLARVELHLKTYLRGLPSAMDLMGVGLLAT
jgi:hypothetical protein